MENPTPKKTTRSKRKAAPKNEAPNTAFQERMNDFQFEVLEVEATPIVEPPPMPTPISEPEPVAVPKVKPWELIRPMQQEDPNAWHRGQKWRP